MQKRVYIRTYGCQMNEHDSARMETMTVRMGYTVTDGPEDADLILINTCSVRANPENKVYSYIGSLRKYKRRKPELIIGVVGCVAQQIGKKFLKKSPLVNMVIGPDWLFSLPEIIERAIVGERIVRTKEVKTDKPKGVLDFVPESELLDGQVTDGAGMVAIMKGCDNFCTYCIVPYTRGREASRSMDSILKEVSDLSAKGAGEIMLLGQNVNSYREGDKTFYDLLKAVSDIKGVKRVRFMSPHPRDWSNELSDLMAARDNIPPYLHLPFQAGSDSVLKSMRRGHKIDAYLEKLKYLRKVCPDVEITADIIVGFPGESEEDFIKTLDVLEQVQFFNVFAFKYSERPGTAAAKMNDNVPTEVKEERLARLHAVQKKITASRLKLRVGTTQEVMLDRPLDKPEGAWGGRLPSNIPVAVVNCKDAKPGMLINVSITGKKTSSLVGERIFT